ncbi:MULTISPECIES: hypothetical protein [Nocardia]|uniref:hypothetical protein n=1 Tax=Nocardia TaxID=1817 RepID=UPI002454F60D|nr:MULTISPECIES: hypothetical protein [Nocardia]
MTEANDPAVAADAEGWRLDPVRLDWDTVLLRDPAYRDPAELLFAGKTMGIGGIAALVGVPVTAFLALLTDWASWWWCILAAGILIVSGLSTAAIGAALDQRQMEKATLTGARLKVLPPALCRPLARAILAIEDIKSGRAFREKYLGELELSATAWQMAQTALRGGELVAARAELLDAEEGVISPADRVAAEAAQRTVDELVADLERDAEALATAAASARTLSTALEDTEARALAETERERISRQQLARRHRLDAALAAVRTADEANSPDTADLAVARAAAYAEVMQLGGTPTPGLVQPD